MHDHVSIISFGSPSEIINLGFSDEIAEPLRIQQPRTKHRPRQLEVFEAFSRGIPPYVLLSELEFMSHT